ncbi:MAG TPA: DinB family protein [Pyrinomonadaceae bacterium]|nr:DinB family protein [Pyrinomonadaceae bacterium]
MDLPAVINAANNVASNTRSTFGHLTPSQLNWKPSPERWSIAQCFDHLIAVNKAYFPVIDNVLAGKKRTLWESMPVLPGLMGKMVIKAVEPTSTRKFKARKNFEAAQSNISGSIINDFVDHQAEVVDKMKATQHLDLEKIIITSPVAAVMTYSLIDAYRIIVVHEQRHFQQAKRVTEETGFPG